MPSEIDPEVQTSTRKYRFSFFLLLFNINYDVGKSLAASFDGASTAAQESVADHFSTDERHD